MNSLSDFTELTSKQHKWPRLLLLGALLSLASCKDENLTPEQRWLATATGQIQQSYQQLAQDTQAQQQQAAQFCTAPDAAGLQQAQSAWRQAMGSWQHIQWLKLGPIAKDNDDWKLQFWPDKKNILQRKTQDILNGSDPITADSLSHASVMVQGFSAQELLLFDTEFAAPEKFAGRQCELLQATTVLTTATTKRLADSWKEEAFLKTWANPKTVPQGHTPAQVRNGELLDALLGQVERVKNDKLGEPLGMKNRDKKPNGYFAESWRSDNSLNNIHQNLLGLQELLRPQEGYGLFQYLKDLGHQPVADELVIKLDNAQQALQQIQPPLSRSVTDAAQQPALQKAHQTLGELATFIKQKLAPALGVSLGFNSNDGD